MGAPNVDIRYCCGCAGSVLLSLSPVACRLSPVACRLSPVAVISMPVCHAASVVLENDSLLYFGPEDAHWRVPVSAIKALGEFRSASMDEGHYLAIVIDESGAWFQAPRRAIGVDQVLSDLALQWNTNLDLSSDRPGSGVSRVLWPAHLAGEEMFELRKDGVGLSLRAELLRGLAGESPG
jgi:hypothetical protein